MAKEQHWKKPGSHGHAGWVALQKSQTPLKHQPSKQEIEAGMVNLDQLIALQAKKLELLKAHKQGVLQHILQQKPRS